jgi:hypothetical protein
MSQRSCTQHKVIVHPRDASTDSRTSSSSRSSAEEHSASTSSRTSTTNGSDGFQYRRVPDNGLLILTHTRSTITDYQLTAESGSMTTKIINLPTSRRIVELHDHQKGRYIEDEPQSSKATYEEYRKTQERKSRR